MDKNMAYVLHLTTIVPEDILEPNLLNAFMS